MSEKDEAQAAFDESGWTEEHGWEREMWESAFEAGLAKGREMERQRCGKLAAQLPCDEVDGYDCRTCNLVRAIRSGK